MEYKLQNIIKGALIYTIGDTIAALLLGQFNVYRLLGMILIGSTVYAFEIPNYFNWIAKITKQYTGLKLSLFKTGLAILYFNPLWIARHYLFIELATQPTLLLNFSDLWKLILNLIVIGTKSFVGSIILSALANYLIQNKISLKNRFLSSAIFGTLMTVYYTLSKAWF